VTPRRIWDESNRSFASRGAGLFSRAEHDRLGDVRGRFVSASSERSMLHIRSLRTNRNWGSRRAGGDGCVGIGYRLRDLARVACSVDGRSRFATGDESPYSIVSIGLIGFGPLIRGLCFSRYWSSTAG